MTTPEVRAFDPRPDPVTEFRGDGWVYKGGQRIRKQYDHYQGIGRVWEGRFVHPNVLARAEDLYHRCRLRCDRHWDTLFDLADRIRKAGGLAHCKPAKCPKGNEAFWYSYETDLDGLYTSGWTTLEGGPRNVELAEAMYRHEKRFAYPAAYARTAAMEFLQLVIARHLQKPEFQQAVPREGNEAVVRLELNGRDYWYGMRRESARRYDVFKIAWPADATLVVRSQITF
jgi:hypothetical protein